MRNEANRQVCGGNGNPGMRNEANPRGWGARQDGLGHRCGTSRSHFRTVRQREGGLVTVDAAALGGDITRSGHAAVYGIYFDTAKAVVKPESDAALKEIANLLQQTPALKLFVVGHTDNVGSLASNMDLSKRRADAVVAALSTKYGVVAARLVAQGCGPLAPVGSNDTENGQAKNRRVELVEQ